MTAITPQYAADPPDAYLTSTHKDQDLIKLTFTASSRIFLRKTKSRIFISKTERAVVREI